MDRLAAVPERRDRFTETKDLAALDAPLVTHGTLSFRAPAHLEKHTAPPFEEHLVVDGDRLTLTRPAEGADYTLRLGQVPELRGLVEAIRGVLAGDLVDLEHYYHVDLEGTSDDWRLTLDPFDLGIRGVIESIEVGGSGADIRRFETIEASGDRSVMVIEQAPG